MRFFRFLSLNLISMLIMQSAYASHLKFSPEFLDAVANCSPLEENITKLNPDFSTYLSTDLAKVKIDFIVKILEQKNTNSCSFSFQQRIDKMGESTAVCQVSDEQREALLYSLKDKTDGEYKDTFDLLQTAPKPEKTPQITIQGSLLHVVYNKILNTSCSFSQSNFLASANKQNISDITQNKNNSPAKTLEKNEEIKATEEDEPFVQYEVFSPQFMKSWQLCKPDATEQNNNGSVKKLEIIGIKDERCQVKFGNFDLNIPLDLMNNVHSFVDVNAILKNEDIAHYSYEPEYIYDGLIYALDMCLQKKDYDGIEKQTSEADNVIIRHGMFSEYINRQCVFHLQNEVEINGSVDDYTVLCYLNDKVINELQPYFKDVIEKYGRKRMFTQDGKIEIRKAEFNEETHKADIALMFYLQQKGFCKHNK